MIVDLAPGALAVIAAAFIIGGAVKGVIGGGLPTVCIPLIALVIDPAVAVSISILPVLGSNLWQALQGGHYREVIRRFWPYLGLVLVGVIAGAQILATADPKLTALVLGSLLIAIPLIQLLLRDLSVPERLQPVLNPIVGGTCGLIGGMTGIFAQTILYAAALRLPKDLLVSLLAMTALSATLPLYISLIANNVLQWNELAMSAVGLIPVAIGMIAGRRVRDRISQLVFQRLLFVGLALLGVKLVYDGLG
ncbi:MAG: sulfite exporter TauE/SafE family protein [Alphaproteobacteria bacterium]|nr:sulfite exporter TauE/SafE family protein [Alphaproteobacteria bacterium]